MDIGKEVKNLKKIIVYALMDRRGGIENFFINYKRYFKNIHLDFIKLVPDKLPYENELVNSDIYYVPRRRDDSKLRKKRIIEVLTAKKYDALWFNSNDLASVDIIRQAQKLGIKCIVHAHNSKATNLNRTIRHCINRVVFDKDFDAKFACSDSAAKWFYPNYEHAFLVYNAINVKKYLFNEKSRNEIRQRYGLNDRAILLGDVARLEKQKNLFYLIDVFYKYHKQNPNSYLMIIGNGSLKKKLKKYTYRKGISNAVIFTGEIDNVQDYLSALDIFVMPSLYEGLPITLVEAQTSGLKCIASDNVTKEVNITKNISYCPIGKRNINIWIDNIHKSKNRVKNGEKMINSPFDIAKGAINLEKEIVKILD